VQGHAKAGRYATFRVVYDEHAQLVGLFPVFGGLDHRSQSTIALQMAAAIVRREVYDQAPYLETNGKSLARLKTDLTKGELESWQVQVTVSTANRYGSDPAPAQIPAQTVGRDDESKKHSESIRDLQQRVGQLEAQLGEAKLQELKTSFTALQSTLDRLTLTVQTDQASLKKVSGQQETMSGSRQDIDKLKLDMALLTNMVTRSRIPLGPPRATITTPPAVPGLQKASNLPVCALLHSFTVQVRRHWTAATSTPKDHQLAALADGEHEYDFNEGGRITLGATTLSPRVSSTVRE